MKVVRKRIMAYVLTFVMALTLMPVLGEAVEVKAADYNENGTYSQTGWDANGKRTTTWTFTSNMPTSTKTLKAGDTIRGITVDNPGSTSSLHKSNYVKFVAGSVFSIPVAKDATSAEVTITVTSKKSDRGITVGGTTKNYATLTNTWTIAANDIKNGSFTITGTGGELYIATIELVETKSTGSGGDDQDVPITAITVAPLDVSLTVGETAKLTASVEPATTTQSKEIKWTSSDESVATVSNDGTVTAKQPGGAIITATSAANDTISASCTITVSAGTGGEVLITSVTIDRQNAALKVGETTDLKASVTPSNTTQSKEITWTSSDTKVATVDNNGKVTAVSAGTVTITAASAANSSFSASCKVVVTTNGGSTGQGNMTAGGWNETIYAQIAGISKADVTGVSYSGTMSGTLTGDDFTYLVRDLNGGGSY